MARKPAPRYRLSKRRWGHYVFDRFRHSCVKSFKTKLAAIEWCALSNLLEEGIDVNAPYVAVPNKPRSRKKRLPVSANAPQCGNSPSGHDVASAPIMDGGQARSGEPTVVIDWDWDGPYQSLIRTTQR